MVTKTYVISTWQKISDADGEANTASCADIENTLNDEIKTGSRLLMMTSAATDGIMVLTALFSKEIEE